MSELTAANRWNLKQYHISLRQFLSVSPAPAKPNPTRAAKAREKLLKLSSSQFFELSTDVYDELQRRISESQEEPNFLLPMASFHPKRNEAREKLGSLQQTRFRDLVSDIFYEIERRNQELDQKEVTDSPNNRVSTTTVLTNASEGSGPQNKYRGSVDSKNSNSGGKKQAVVTLQPTTVIPTKADMAWSSDEEEDESGQPANSHAKRVSLTSSSIQSPGSVSKAVTAVVASQSPYASSNRTSTRTSGTSLPSPTSYRQVPSVPSNESPRVVSSKRFSNSSQESGSSARDTVGEMNGHSPNEQRVQRGLSLNKNRNKDREIELLLQEGTKMDTKITNLEQKNTLLQTKAEKFEQEVSTLQELKDNLTTKISKLETELEQSKTKISQIQSELDSRDAKIEKLESDQKNPSETNGVRDLGITSQVGSSVEIPDSVWKEKYMAVKQFHEKSTSSVSPISDESIVKFTTPNGIISTNLVLQLRQEVQSYISSLSEVNKLQGNPGILFEHMSSITDTANKITCLVPQSEKTEMVRASISHAITSTRYYSVYSELLPKLVVESAVSQVAFSVFELVQDVKLKNDGSSTATTPVSSGRPTPTYEDADSSVSPVRPLRMAKKSDKSSLSSIPRSVSTTLTPKPLNLTINSQLANGAQNSERKPFALVNRGSPMTSKSNGSTIEVKTPSKASPITTRYSPEGSKVIGNSPPANGLRKSSSSNILSKVKQFEQNSETTPISSPSPKKSIVSPLSDDAIGMFGKRKVSEPFVNARPLAEAVPTSSGAPMMAPVVSTVAQSEDSSVKPPESNSLPLITSATSHGVLDDTPKTTESLESPESLVSKKSPVEVMESPNSSPAKSSLSNGDLKPSSDLIEYPALKSPDPTKNNDDDDDNDDNDDYEDNAADARSRQADEENFDVDDFDIEDPDNTLSELLLYLEHQTVKVISTIQALLTSIKTADSTKGDLRSGSKDISDVVSQMVDATSNSMNQSRNAQLKEHGRWVVDSLADSKRRMNVLCLNDLNKQDDDDEYADKQFKQRLAGIAFDVAKCTKELVKSVEEANLKDEIAHLNARLVR